MNVNVTTVLVLNEGSTKIQLVPLESTLNLDGVYSQNQFSLSQDSAASHGTDVNINNYISFSNGTINTNGSYTPEVSNAGSTIELTNGGEPSMPAWRKNLFIATSRLSTDAAEYFNLPRERTLIVGSRIDV